MAWHHLISQPNSEVDEHHHRRRPPHAHEACLETTAANLPRAVGRARDGGWKEEGRSVGGWEKEGRSGGHKPRPEGFHPLKRERRTCDTHRGGYLHSNPIMNVGAAATTSCGIQRGGRKYAVWKTSLAGEETPLPTSCQSLASSAVLRTKQRKARCDRCSAAEVSARMLFSPPPFDPKKVTITYSTDTPSSNGKSAFLRCYTLTHNDLTGQLFLTVGSEYNKAQISPPYVKFLRDEVVATWKGQELHVYCFISGEGHWWLAPASLREYIFRREMPLVMDTLRYADKNLVNEHPEYSNYPVFVHFCGSHGEKGGNGTGNNRTEFWGAYATARGPVEEVTMDVDGQRATQEDMDEDTTLVSCLAKEIKDAGCLLESRLFSRPLQARPTAIHAVPVNLKVKAATGIKQSQSK